MPDDPSFFGKKAMDQGSSPNLPVGSLATNKFHNGSESLLIGKVRGISSLPSDFTSMMSILVKGPTASQLVLVLGRDLAREAEAEDTLLDNPLVFTWLSSSKTVLTQAK
jgi:hypothetical protein